MNAFTFLVLFFVADTLGGPKNSPLCPQIKLKFGRVRYRQRGRIARFICNTGYMLAGDRYSVCVQGQWDNVSPKCVRASCRSVKAPANGLIYPSHSGAVLNFFCKSNYALRGPNITYCDGDKWENPLPTCLPTDSSVPLSCDFEREDLCGWNHDPNHDFDWKRLNRATPSGSIGTGPSHDHTGGAGKDGYYMYIESSARNVNDTARLISPVYDRSPVDDVCFEFYYHMYGTTTGDLRVYLKKIGQTWDLDPDGAVFAKNGNQGDKWYRGFVVLGTVDDDYQIIIEGVRGSGYVSDIAIDDVRIIQNCTKQEEITITTTDQSTSMSEQPITVESCENRCQTNDTLEIDWLITCDCDDRCFDRNRCCPDFLDFCVFAGTSLDDFEETSSQMSSTVAVETTPTTVKTTVKTTTTTVVEVTERKESEVVYVTPSDVEEVAVAKTTTAIVKEFEPDYSYHGDKSVKQKIIVEPEVAENDTRTIIFVFGVVFGVLFGVVGMAFVAKRYRLFRCLTLRRLNHSANGDSQSDVRFLTSDEILDLNLPSDYNTL